MLINLDPRISKSRLQKIYPPRWAKWSHAPIFPKIFGNENSWNHQLSAFFGWLPFPKYHHLLLSLLPSTTHLQVFDGIREATLHKLGKFSRLGRGIYGYVDGGFCLPVYSWDY